jgi:hypothetical protein
MTNNTISVNGGALPRTARTSSADALRDRRQFIGGSDARVIMGKDEKACCGSGKRSGVRLLPPTCPPF